MGGTVAADGAPDKPPFSCRQFGDDYKRLLKLNQCFKVNGALRAGILINDPDDQNKDKPIAQPLMRLQTDVKVVRKSAIGVLSSFIRFQAELNPGLMSDKMYQGIVNDPFAVGIDGVELALEKPWGTIKTGKIQNAVSHAMPHGFTNRGAESLNGRAAAGASLAIHKKNWNMAFSITDPSATTSREAHVPNLGFGLNIIRGPWVFGIGAALLNVDKIMPITTNIPLPRLVANGAPFNVHASSQHGWAAGVSARFKGDRHAAYFGVGYTKAAANDAIFAFSDGFDALSVFSGVSYRLSEKVDLGFDFSFVSALGNGMHRKRGIETALRIGWRPFDHWIVASEVGYDTVPNFGAGNGFFYSIKNSGQLDFRLTVDREF